MPFQHTWGELKQHDSGSKGGSNDFINIDYTALIVSYGILTNSVIVLTGTQNNTYQEHSVQRSGPGAAPSLLSSCTQSDLSM